MNIGPKSSSGVRMKFREGEIVYIKDNISRNIHMAGVNFKALESLMQIVVTEEDTLLKAEF
jgi:hypothetical protein